MIVLIPERCLSVYFKVLVFHEQFVCLILSFSFGFEGGMVDLIVLAPNHCLSILHSFSDFDPVFKVICGFILYRLGQWIDFFFQTYKGIDQDLIWFCDSTLGPHVKER